MTVYILSHKIFTGGPESLHQFGSELRKKGIDVRMIYTNPDLKLPDRLAIYNVPSVKDITEIVDDAKNVFVVPEDCIHYFNHFQNIKKCIWWLSLHYYLTKLDRDYLIKHTMPNLPRILYIIPRLYLRLKRGKPLEYYIPQQDDGIYHLYNCEYVRQYLESCHVHPSNTCYLCGPIEQVYYSQNCNVEKEDIVLYNPKKGLKFTEKILIKLNELNIPTIPIQKMTASEIKATMDRGKIYIDFGFFPGPERIPREAVISNCLLLTSRTGAAANDIDVPIPNKFKIEAKDENVDIIVEKIQFMLNNYADLLSGFDEYRLKVNLQNELFLKGVDTFIKYMHISQ